MCLDYYYVTFLRIHYIALFETDSIFLSNDEYSSVNKNKFSQKY